MPRKWIPRRFEELEKKECFDVIGVIGVVGPCCGLAGT